MGSWYIFGDIDLTTAAGFAADLCAMIDAAETHRVPVDCSSITFIDSSGFHAFAAADRHARTHGHQLVMTHLRLAHATVLDLCDWDHQLTVVDDLPDAA